VEVGTEVNVSVGVNDGAMIDVGVKVVKEVEIGTVRNASGVGDCAEMQPETNATTTRERIRVRIIFISLFITSSLTRY
jgi:hypothetical protein